MQSTKHTYQTQLINNEKSTPRIVDMRATRKLKRIRSAFTTDQLNYLEKEFSNCPYINNIRRKDVAMALRLSEKAIKVWFQNRRMKMKKDTNSKDQDEDLICIGPIKNSNNQLNNEYENRSVNDQKAYSLPILSNTNSVDTDCQVIEDDRGITNYMKQHETKPTEVDCYVESPYFKNQMPISKDTHTTFTVLKRGPSSNNLDVTPSELSIDLYKKYKSQDKCIKIKDKKICYQKMIKNNNTTHCNQVPNISTNLTSQKKADTSLEQKPIKNVTPNSEYIPVVPNFYPQSYVHPGGVMWNPINVVPLMSTGAAITVPNAYNTPVNHNNAVPRTNCTCDCHMKPYPVSIAFQQSPQYVMTAVPLQNPSTKF